MRFYENNPTYFSKQPVDWETGTPESRGLSRKRILELAESLGRRKQAFSLLVARGGVLVWEQYFNGSAAFHSNNIHSASKTILSALVGIAQKNGRLKIDQPISDFLPSGYAKGSAGRISIRQLLTMTSGVRWKEDKTEFEIERESDWVRAILKPRAGAPGKFNYCTGNTHLLSTVLSKAVGMPVSDFAQTYLFKPLGISVEHWGRDPQGNDSGGCNVYMTPQCLAKLGQLFLNKGRWRGKSVVPADWIAESWTPLATRRLCNYGYLCWLNKSKIPKRKSLVMWGYGGQFVIVMPDIELVAVMTHDTCEGHRRLTDAEEEVLLTRLIDGLASAVV